MIYAFLYIVGVLLSWVLLAIYNDYICPDHDEPIDFPFVFLSWVAVIMSLILFCHPNAKKIKPPTFKK